MPGKTRQVPDSVFLTSTGIPRRWHKYRNDNSLTSEICLLVETMRKSSNTWLIFPQPWASDRNCIASENDSNIAKPDLEPIGRVQSQSQSPYHRRPKAGISCRCIGISLYACSMSVFANTALGLIACMREMALSTVSYEMVRASVGICELTNGPPKGAERSWMTRNLHSVFFSLRPKRDTTKCENTGLENGPILLLAASSVQNFTSMALGFTLADLWLDLECDVWEDDSHSMTTTWESNVSLKPSVNPFTK